MSHNWLHTPNYKVVIFSIKYTNAHQIAAWGGVPPPPGWTHAWAAAAAIADWTPVGNLLPRRHATPEQRSTAQTHHPTYCTKVACASAQGFISLSAHSCATNLALKQYP